MHVSLRVEDREQLCEVRSLLPQGFLFIFNLVVCGCVVNMSQHACVSRKTIVAVGLLLPSVNLGDCTWVSRQVMAGAFTTESCL